MFYLIFLWNLENVFPLGVKQLEGETDESPSSSTEVYNL
jgi:hypothetical protein